MNDFRLSARTVMAYAAAWGVVLLGGWASSRTSGAAHTVLVLASGLLCLYLLYLAGIWVFVVGVAALLDGRVPLVWWLIGVYWALGVVAAVLVAWVGLGVRDTEALWMLGSILAGGLVVTVVLGRVGLAERRAASKLPPEPGEHRRD